VDVGADFPADAQAAEDVQQLNAGVHAQEAAERAGHGVDVMLRVYAKCIDGQREVATGGSWMRSQRDPHSTAGPRDTSGPFAVPEPETTAPTSANGATSIPRMFRDQRSSFAVS
jgi:hypothetical protein